MRAFTLLEVLLALGLSTLLTLFSLVIGMSALRHGMQRSSESTYTTATSFARLATLHGRCSHAGCVSADAHGVQIFPTSVAIFEGTSFESRWVGFDLSLLLSAPASSTYPRSSIYFADDRVSNEVP